jgi:hypothetical protein
VELLGEEAIDLGLGRVLEHARAARHHVGGDSQGGAGKDDERPEDLEAVAVARSITSAFVMGLPESPTIARRYNREA